MFISLHIFVAHIEGGFYGNLIWSRYLPSIIISEYKQNFDIIVNIFHTSTAIFSVETSASSYSHVYLLHLMVGERLPKSQICILYN